MFSLEPAALIKQFPLFDQELASFISEEAETKIFNQDDVLMRPGQFFKYAMLVVRGRVKLFREGDEGEEFFMYYLEPGNACALSMLCMARSQSSSIMAVAVEETEVVMIPIQHMDNLMKNYPSWYHFVIETYRSRFEEVLNVVDQIAQIKTRIISVMNFFSEKIRKTKEFFSDLNMANLKTKIEEIIAKMAGGFEEITPEVIAYMKNEITRLQCEVEMFKDGIDGGVKFMRCLQNLN
jgi:CRP/FNR family transcriptional regulator